MAVYVIGADGSPAVKIGTSTNPARRLASMQTSTPFALSLLATFDGGHELEQALHREFADQRVRREWFDLSPLGDPVEVVQAAITLGVAGLAQRLADRRPAVAPPAPPVSTRFLDDQGREIVIRRIERLANEDDVFPPGTPTHGYALMWHDETTEQRRTRVHECSTADPEPVPPRTRLAAIQATQGRW